MRRRSELMNKLRVKILEDYRAGLTYSEIQRRRGASSRTIANLVKGKDLRRFCQMCGETDQEKLEEHHPNKMIHPSETVTLCAGKGFCYSIGGIAFGEGAFHNRLPGWIRGLLVIGGILFLYGGSRIGRDTEHTDQ